MIGTESCQLGRPFARTARSEQSRPEFRLRQAMRVKLLVGLLRLTRCFALTSPSSFPALRSSDTLRHICQQIRKIKHSLSAVSPLSLRYMSQGWRPCLLRCGTNRLSSVAKSGIRHHVSLSLRIAWGFYEGRWAPLLPLYYAATTALYTYPEHIPGSERAPCLPC
jgi:hypothetical protein